MNIFSFPEFILENFNEENLRGLLDVNKISLIWLKYF